MTPPPTPLPETKFNHLLVGIIFALMVAFAGALFTVMRSEPDARQVWRIAITNWPGYDYLYLAQEKGFFAEQNLNIKLIPINSTTDIRTAFERNTIDGYTAAIMDVVESIQDTSTKSRIVLITDYSNGGDELLVDPSITALPTSAASAWVWKSPPPSAVTCWSAS
jgi:NitT/TauT family transport system substrate-binding protein